MYNEDRKQRFYEFKLKTVASVTPLVPRFKRVAPFEHMYQKDLCDFNLNEITEMYKLFKFTTLESIIVVNNTLTQYTDWCVNENLVLNGQNIYATITPDMLAALLNKTLLNHQIVSRDTILTWIEALKNPRDRFMILSIFEYGKSKDFEDTIRAKLDDIDVENHTMKLYSGRVVNVSEALILTAQKSNMTMELTYPYGTKSKLMDDGTIIKRSHIVKDDPHCLGRQMYNSLAAALKSIDVSYMTAEKINISGQIHMTNELIRKYNSNKNKILYDVETRSMIEHQYGIKINRPSYFLKKYGNYLI